MGLDKEKKTYFTTVIGRLDKGHNQLYETCILSNQEHAKALSKKKPCPN